MRRIFLLTMLVALSLGIVMGMGVVGAQETAENESDELEDEMNATIPANASTGFSNQEIIPFNDNTRIVGWEFRDGTIRVALHTDRRAGVTVSDALAGIGEKGAVQVPETTQFLERNETTTVQMDVSAYNGGQSVGVTVDGMTVRLSSEMDDEDDNPLRYFGGEQGLMFGMFMSVVMSGGAAGFVIWREETGVIKA